MRESRYRGLTSSVCFRQIGGACRYHHGRTDVDHHESLIQVENIGYWYSRYEHNILRLWRQIRIHPLKSQINLPDIPNSPPPNSPRRIILQHLFSPFLLSKIPPSITQWQIHQRVLQQQMKHNIPSHQSSKEAENTTGFLQSHRRCVMTIRKSKVTRRDEEESKIHEEKDQDVRDVAGERCDQEREDEDRPDDHEESNRVVVLGYIVAVGLGDAKGGREEGAVAGVEET